MHSANVHNKKHIYQGTVTGYNDPQRADGWKTCDWLRAMCELFLRIQSMGLDSESHNVHRYPLGPDLSCKMLKHARDIN